MGHLNSLFAPRVGNLNKPIFKSSNARGVARGGMLKLQFDWYISGTVYSFESTLIVVFFSRGVVRPHMLSITLFSGNYAK